MVDARNEGIVTIKTASHYFSKTVIIAEPYVNKNSINLVAIK